MMGLNSTPKVIFEHGIHRKDETSVLSVFFVFKKYNLCVSVPWRLKKEWKRTNVILKPMPYLFVYERKGNNFGLRKTLFL